MEYLDFQGALDQVNDDGEGITLRFVPDMSDAIEKINQIYIVYIDKPDNAEKIGKILVEYADNYEVESVGVENGSTLEIYFFDIEAPVVITGAVVDILKTSLGAEDYEKYIRNMRALNQEYLNEVIELREKLKGVSQFIDEVEKRWALKLKAHELSSMEDRLHKEFVKTLNRVRQKLCT